MVSQKRQRRQTPGTRERIVAAATAEFAARGFDGAKVDRIAARARVNKAMLYYHFDSKADLYRAILRELFASVARELTAERTAAGTPEDRLRQFVRILAATTAGRPHYPSIWLREMAENGRHLDASILELIAGILQTLADILREGRARGVFRQANPLVVQMTIVAPLLLFAASAPMRARFAEVLPGGAGDLPLDALVDHVETTVLSSLAPIPASPSQSRTRSRSR